MWSCTPPICTLNSTRKDYDMIKGKRRLVFMLSLLACVTAAEIVISGGMSTNAQVVLLGSVGLYIGGDSYVKGKDEGKKP